MKEGVFRDTPKAEAAIVENRRYGGRSSLISL